MLSPRSFTASRFSHRFPQLRTITLLVLGLIFAATASAAGVVKDVTQTTTPGNFLAGYTLTTSGAVGTDDPAGIYLNEINANVAGWFRVDADGSSVGAFDLTDLAFVKFSTQGDFTFTITGYKAGGGTVTTSFTTNGSSTSYTSGNYATFTGITGFRIDIQPTDGSTSIDQNTFDSFTADNVALPGPTLSSATYNANTGVLAVTATGMTTGDTIDVSKLTLTGEGGASYTLTSPNVTASSSSAFSITLNATDKGAVNQILNKNGTSSTGGTTYNLAGADDWDANITTGDSSDATGNGVTVSNIAAPAITSATYDANTGTLIVTGTGFLTLSGAANDIVANKFTFTGEGGATYTLTDSANVNITSGTTFTLTLSATDKSAVNQIINRNGTSSTGGTTYNLAAAEDWAAGAHAAVVVADTTGNGITTSNVAVPAISNATYNAATGTLVVTGTGFPKLNGATNDVFANKFTLGGEGGATYTLTDTANVEIDSGTGFTLTLSATDKAAVNLIINKNGGTSTDISTYTLAAAEDWAAGADAAVSVADMNGNNVTASNVAVPAVTSATYDGSTGVLVVTGTGFLTRNGATNDIVANKFTFTGEGGSTYTLTDTANVEITSGTSFSLTLSATDRNALTTRINKDGTSAVGGTTYNLAAAEDWAAGAEAAVVVADLTGNGITASNADLVAPAVSTVSVPANGTYVVGQSLDFTVNFSENVVVNTGGGTPYLALTLGAASQNAGYLSGSGTSALVFRYTVQTGDLDTDGIAVGVAVTLNGGSIRDAANNNATVTLNSVGSTASVLVDGVAPTISSSSVPAAATYSIGQNLDFTVTFSENVTVNTGGGTPYVAVTLETGGSVQAAYVSGSSTATLTFRYTIASGNADTNGIAVASSLTLNGGTIRDAAGNNAQTTSLGFASTAAVLVDGVPPTVSSIVRVTAATTNATSVDYTVTFSESVSGVDTSDFTLTATGTASGSVASIAVVNGSTYTVAVNTISGDGTLRLDLKNAGTGIADTPGNAIATGFTSGQSYTIDSTAPAVTSVSVPSNGTYSDNQNLDFTVNFAEAVTVNTAGGTPQFALTIGSTTRHATYLSGSSSSALVFRYTIQTGDVDSDGVAVGSLSANGGTLRDSAGNNAILTLNSVGSTTAILVDADGPTISGSTVPANATYSSGQNLNFTVTYSENVTVNTGGGTPYLALTLETGGSVQAAYHSGSGTSTLTFRYAVASGNADTDGIAVATSLTLNGGTIRDASSNDAATGTISFGSTAAVLVDGVPPTVSSIDRQTPSASSTNATSVTYRVTFSEAVSGVDSSDFTLTTTGTAAGSIASVAPVSSSVYDVSVNTISGDGTLRLDLKASGTGIADTPGNAIATGFTSGQTYTVDNTAPSAASILRETPATVITATATVTWRLTFSEEVTGVDTADFALTAVFGTPSGTVGSVTPVSGSVYDVAVTSVAGIGTLRLDLKTSGTGIADASGNALAGGFATGDIYIVGASSVFDAVSLTTGTTRTVSHATTNQVAQRFTTAASAPLSLSVVTAALGALTGSPTPIVTVNADASGAPGSVIATLTNPSNLAANTLNTWTSSTLLAASTTYWIVFSDTSAAGGYAVKETAASSGGTGAWLTNPDYGYYHGVHAGTGPQAGALQIAIGATSVPTINSPLTSSGTYGSAMPTYTITATNLPSTFNATGLPPGLTLNTTSGAITGTPTLAGTFNVSLTATNASGTSTPATLVITIAKVPLTVTANSAARAFGALNPAFTVAYSGLLNGDTPASLTTAPTASTLASIVSPVGTYPITVGGGVSSNYVFTYLDGTLSIVPASTSGGSGGGGGSVTATTVTITLSGLTATYDGSAKSVTAVTSPAGVDVALTYDGNAAAPTDVGSYAVAATVNAAGMTGSASGTLTINKAPQSISLGALADKSTGDAPFTISAFANSGLPVMLTIAGPATLNGSTITLNGTPGTVTITATQGGNANYLAATGISRNFAVTAPSPRIFIGDAIGQSGGKIGDIAGAFPPTGNNGNLLIIAPSLGLDLALEFTLGAEGRFVKAIVHETIAATSENAGLPPVAAAPRTFTFSGQLANGILSGRCDEAGLTFSIPVQSRGATSDAAGFYKAPTINDATGATYAVVGNHGEVIALASTNDTVAGGRTTLNANGTFALDVGTTSLRGSIDTASTSVTGVISRAGTSDVSFSGIAATTLRTDRLINLSSRSRIGPSSDRTLITGFVIGGAQSKRVLLRAVGPTLATFGVSGSLSNPRIQVYDGTGRLMLENDDWSGTDTASAFAQTGAFTLPVGTRDAALVATLPPGPYTVHVLDGGETGTALAEIYDASPNPNAEYQRLVNISSRGMVESGDGLLIGGFVVTGNTPKRMLIRGIGPSLATHGVIGALVDPKLTLYSSQTKIAENDNWGTPIAVGANQSVASAADIAAAAQATGAFALANATRDASLVVTLAPGAYTAQVSSSSGNAGVALVEIYEIPE